MLSLLGVLRQPRVLRDDFAPLLMGEDALDHERLWHKLTTTAVGSAWTGYQAQAAVDLALWISRVKFPVAGLQAFGGRRKVRRSMALTALVVYERVRNANGLRGLS